MKPIKSTRQWNRFCLWVALLGGNLAGIVFVLPDLSMALGSPLWSPIWHRDFQRVGNIFLMMTVSVLARAPRRRLLWVFVPPSLWLIWSITDRIVSQNWQGLVSDLHHNVPGAALSLLFGCVIALVTGKFGKGLEEPDVEPEFGGVDRIQPQDGVWPPPPRRPD